MEFRETACYILGQERCGNAEEPEVWAMETRMIGHYARSTQTRCSHKQLTHIKHFKEAEGLGVQLIKRWNRGARSGAYL